jgi:ADP-ribosylglycohydrolase
MSSARSVDSVRGCLLGLAVGDAIGLPYEGLSRRRISRLTHGRPLRHRFARGRGMFSDDTEHACMALQALLAAGDDPEEFGRTLARKLRWWVAALPAGIGWATLRATLKLWLGWNPGRSGVRSAGNGACMRAPVIGVWADPNELEHLVAASTRITHTDPRAMEGALVVARAAAVSPATPACDVLPRLLRGVTGEELRAALEAAAASLAAGASPAEFADRMGWHAGVNGYVNRSVPAALYCWLREAGDFRAAVEAAVRLGGDTDTTAAITGGLAGARLGAAAIPADWLAGLCDWPRSRAWLERLAESTAGEVPLFWPAVPWRNGMFTVMVLFHAVRRMLPPY